MREILRRTAPTRVRRSQSQFRQRARKLKSGGGGQKAGAGGRADRTWASGPGAQVTAGTLARRERVNAISNCVYDTCATAIVMPSSAAMYTALAKTGAVAAAGTLL